MVLSSTHETGKNHSMLSCLLPDAFSARWGSVPRFYVLTDKDNAVAPQLQQNMVKKMGVTKSFFLKGSDHTPHLSTPEALAKIIDGVAKM